MSIKFHILLFATFLVFLHCNNFCSYFTANCISIFLLRSWKFWKIGLMKMCWYSFVHFSIITMEILQMVKKWRIRGWQTKLMTHIFRWPTRRTASLQFKSRCDEIFNIKVRRSIIRLLHNLGHNGYSFLFWYNKFRFLFHLQLCLSPKHENRW